MRLRRSLTFLLCALFIFAQMGAALHATSHMDHAQQPAQAAEHDRDQSAARSAPDRVDGCGLCLAFGALSAGAASGALPAFEESVTDAIVLPENPSRSKAHWTASLPRGPPACPDPSVGTNSRSSLRGFP
jgi:hypothetical protein